MKSEETRRNYNDIAHWWLEQMKNSSYGVAALERALSFMRVAGRALDVGCGCEGRFIRLLQERKFHCTGLDISEKMIELASQRLPNADFIAADICSWEAETPFNFISAWDSTFHLSLENQEPVLRKLCSWLSSEGVLLFTCGGGDKPENVEGEFGGRRFGYSTLGVPEFVRILTEASCSVRHIEYDQYPERHVYIIAQKSNPHPD